MTSNERPRFEVADVVRRYGDDFHRIYRSSATQQAVLRHITLCRTAALGGHLDQCDTCQTERISHNSCRDRHCPKCQSARGAQWVTEREARLLPIPYFHVVFTIPHQLNALALANKKILFDILFATSAQTLQTIANDPEHLGAQIGFTSVLHTWGQTLSFHPHVHCIVTGGGLNDEQNHWVAAQESFLFSVKVLSALFRGKFLDALNRAHQENQLDFVGQCSSLAQPAVWQRLKDDLYNQNWVVYAKAPFKDVKHLYRYLSRYTHRVAISNHRIINIADGNVTFSYRDYADGNKQKRMSLATSEFIRRFLMHTLPKKYTRIRHFGLCASTNVNTKLVLARQLLEVQGAPGSETPATIKTINESPQLEPWWTRFLEQTGIDVMACPHCSGRFQRLGSFPRQSHHLNAAPPSNTS